MAEKRKIKLAGLLETAVCLSRTAALGLQYAPPKQTFRTFLLINISYDESVGNAMYAVQGKQDPTALKLQNFVVNDANK